MAVDNSFGLLVDTAIALAGDSWLLVHMVITAEDMDFARIISQDPSLMDSAALFYFKFIIK